MYKAIKAEMEKAYDSLDWNFINGCPFNLGLVKDGLVGLCNA